MINTRMKNDYLNLVEFWNQNFILSEEDKNQILTQINPDEDYKQLAPSQKLLDVLSVFKGKSGVLDYGCGSGWASIIMAKLGVQNITAVDVATNSIEMTNCYVEAFKVQDQIKSIYIDENWLKNQKEGEYVGFFSSNVIDVVPIEMAKDIIKESARVLQKGGIAVFGLNYYIDSKEMEKRGCIVDGLHVYINNVLRLTSLKDKEWLDLFKEYYELVNLSYFSWPGEEKETRRLFVLKRK